MNKYFAIGFGAAIFAIILAVWFGFVQTKGNHLAPSGWIANVRTQALADDLTLMVIDFGLLNDADQQMVVGKIDPWFTARDGNEIHGTLYSGSDIGKTFAFYPKLGPQVNPALLIRGTIDGHKTVNRMVAVEFDVPLRVVESRRGMTLRLEDITGPAVELTGQ